MSFLVQEQVKCSHYKKDPRRIRQQELNILAHKRRERDKQRQRQRVELPTWKWIIDVDDEDEEGGVDE